MSESEYTVAISARPARWTAAEFMFVTAVILGLDADSYNQSLGMAK